MLGFIIKMLLKGVMFPVRLAVNGFGYVFDKDGRREGNTIEMLPILMVLYSIGVTIVSYISYIINNGYGHAIEVFKKDGVAILNNGRVFTYGNTSNFFTVGSIIVVIGLEFVVFFSYVLENKRDRANKKNSISILAILTALSLFGVVKRILGVALTKGFGALTISFNTIYNNLGIASFGKLSLIIAFIIFVLDKRFSYRAKRLLYSVYISLVFMPLVLLTLENIIGMGLYIVALFLLTFVFGMGGAVTSSTVEYTGDMYEADSYRKEAKKAREDAYYGRSLKSSSELLKHASDCDRLASVKEARWK